MLIDVLEKQILKLIKKCVFHLTFGITTTEDVNV